ARLGDDNLFGILTSASQAVRLIRNGSGPRLLEIPTYRWKEHVGPGEDFHAGYRSIEDAGSWMERDQVAEVAELLDTASRQRIEEAVDAEIADAFLFAEASPFPADDQL